jgi:hypothetical protein
LKVSTSKGTGVQEHATLARDRADLGDRLHGADLVVGEHHRDEDRLVGDGSADVFRVDHAVRVDRQVGDLVALLLEALAGVEHGLVLDLRRDDVVALVLVELCHALDGEVVRLGGARGEDDLLRVLGAEQRRQALTRDAHGLFGDPAEGVVAARGVAELLREVRQHLLEHARVDGRGRVVVHVNRELDRHRWASGGA